MALPYNLKDPEEVKEYLKNLYIEYKFGCYSEKKPDVCHLLGDYEESIKLNNEEAAKIYKMTCDTMNYGRSCTKYGDFSMVGRGCEQNSMNAYKYMKKGCELNDAKGCFHAGAIAVTTEDFEEDRSKQIADGIKMLHRACENNEEKACFHLMGIYISGITGYVEKDFTKSYRYGTKCCDFGNPYACANLSLMHKNGDGVEKNEEISAAFKDRAMKLMQELQTSKKQLNFHQGIGM
nr:cytochrome c oxidase assembly factor 7 homolog [Megalopta genalis]